LRRQQKGQPFCLYLAHSMLHVVIGASPEFVGTTDGDLYGDTLAEVDHHTGRVLDELEALGLAENTYVLLTSDNGPWSQPERVERYFESHGGHLATGDSGGLRGAKGSSWEGGVRVPAVLWGPGRVPAGRESSAIASTLDVMPTLAALAGAVPPEDRVFDGVDQSALWRGEDDSGARDTFHYFVRMELHAVRRGRWKLAMPRERFHGYAPDVRAVAGHYVLGRGLDVPQEPLDHAALEDVGAAHVFVDDLDDAFGRLVTPAIGGACPITQVHGLFERVDRCVM